MNARAPEVDASNALRANVQDSLPSTGRINCSDTLNIQDNFIYKNGKKHHRYSIKEAPYPRSYDGLHTDLEATLASMRIVTYKRPSFAFANQSPDKVLDIGCGSGSWILQTAQVWKQTHFVGLDLVPLQPNLERIGNADLKNRITWVHANFLQGLPFPDNHFDLVCISKIAAGIPEDKCMPFFEEVHRVMKPGAVLEILEDDIALPGSVLSSSSPPSAKQLRDPPLEMSEIEPLALPPVLESQSSSDTFSSTASTLVSSLPFFNRSFLRNSDDTLEGNAGAKTMAASRHNGAVSVGLKKAGDEKGKAQVGTNRGQAENTHQPLMQNRERQMSASTLEQDHSLSTATSSIPLGPFSFLSRKTQNRGRASLRNADLHSRYRSQSEGKPWLGMTETGAPGTSGNPTPVPASASSPSIHQTSRASGISGPQESLHVHCCDSPMHPSNPRDHCVIERIYREMHEARFINCKPTSILVAILDMYFSKIRAEMPIQIVFPPRRPRKEIITEDEYNQDDFFEQLYGQEHSLILRSSIEMLGTLVQTSPCAFLHKNTEKFFIRDMARSHLSTTPHQKPQPADPSGISAMTTSCVPQVSSTSEKMPHPSALAPAATKNSVNGLFGSGLIVDLHLHLMYRLAEVLGCTESMWEWVRAEQARFAAEQERFGGRRTGSVNGGSANLFDEEHDPQMKCIRSMSRQDFDSCMLRFELDMREVVDLGHLIERDLQIPSGFPMRNTSRKEFEAACAAWEAEHGSDESMTSKRISRCFRYIACQKAACS